MAIIMKISCGLKVELKSRGIDKKVIDKIAIIRDGKVHMADLAVYASAAVNGVAAIHTEIIKNEVLADWHKIYPD